MNNGLFKNAFAESHHTPAIRTLRSILPGQQPIHDFCVPVNIGFPPPAFIDSLHAELIDRLKYYPGEPRLVREKFARFLGLKASNLVAGNGSTELFYYILSASGKKRRLMTCVPTFGRWTDAPKASGHYVRGYQRLAENGYGIDIDEFVRLARTDHIDTVILSNPNNPTGAVTGKREMLSLIDRLKREVPQLELIIIDESFLDFSPDRREISLLHDVVNMDGVVVLKSLGKSFGLHGTRMGVLVAEARFIADFEPYVPFWNVNGMAEAVIDLMPRFMTEFEQSLNTTIAATEELRHQLGAVPSVTVSATHANFVYLQLPEECDPIRLRDRLLIDHGILIRSCGNKEGATAHHFRIATRPKSEVNLLVSALQGLLSIK